MTSGIDLMIPGKCHPSREIFQEPLPNQFEMYLPWACKQLELPYHIDVNKIYPRIYTPRKSGSSRPASKRSKSKTEKLSTDSSGQFSDEAISLRITNSQERILIEAFYNTADHLTNIKFTRNNYVPADILRIIYLITRFYPYLTAFTINKGLDQEGLEELNKIMNSTKSNITDIILDNNMIPQANYYILLNNNSPINYLSLARCSLNDCAIEEIASRLLTSNLSVLNLSSNFITDEGAICLGNMLRKNRKLRYLNLAGNMITDEGADSILSSLTKFTLTPDEIREYKIKCFAKWKNDLNLEHVKDEATNLHKEDSKRKLKTNEIKHKNDVLKHRHSSRPGINLITSEDDDILKKDGTYYCLGNNNLCYLNLAYNNLTYFSVKKLYKVLCEQNESDRKPKGLINVCIEGNNLPADCMELHEINNIIARAVPVKASQAKHSGHREKTLIQVQVGTLR